MMNKISVIVTTHNHENYISRCLENVINQKGDFQMEVIVGDDFSSDNTRAVIRNYQRRYPSIISLFSAKKNLGITKNLKRCLDACSGDYVAICEADDYWTDIYKLQKQMMFLEEHKNYSMCFSAIIIYYEKQNRYEPFTNQLLLKTDHLKTEDLISDNSIGNFSCCMYRSETVKRLPQSIFNIFTDDWMFNIACSQRGEIGFIRDWMSVFQKSRSRARAALPEIESLHKESELIDTYNQILNYKYDNLFLERKAKVNQRIKQLQEPNSIWDIAKKILTTTLRYSRKLIRIIRQKYQRKLTRMEDGINRSIVSFNEKHHLSISLPGMKNKMVDLIILDTVFPHPFSQFRFTEFNYYLNQYPESVVLTTGEHLPALKEKRSIRQIIDIYSKEYPQFKNRVVSSSHEIKHYEASLAYLIFLNNTVLFIDSLEKKKIPFIFTLYPGGGFELDNQISDDYLDRVFSSPCFRKVIVTQKITYDYLIQKNFCESDKIEFIYGVVTSLPSLDNKKVSFGFEKDTLDICFVAHKYMKNGIDKGYDVFIETAKKLCSKYRNIHFYVVGSYTKNDIPIDDIEDRITFCGLRSIEWFDEFYLDKDIILSPNIPFTLLKGSFDGFPTASCTDAGLRKVAMFCTDILKLNIKFTDRKDIVIIPHDSDGIVDLIDYYYSHPAELKKIAENGSKKIRDVYSNESQILPRIKIINEILGEKYNAIKG